MAKELSTPDFKTVFTGFALSVMASFTMAQNRELLWRVDQAVTLPDRVAFFGEETAAPIDFRPTFQLGRVLATANASFIAVPLNIADIDPINAQVVTPPSWAGTRAWQVAKVDANGIVLWKRQIISSSPRFTDFKLTAEGGVALLLNRQFSVFGPNGEVRFAGDTLSELCVNKIGVQPAIPFRVFLTDSDALVINYEGSNLESARACAYNYQGTLIDTINSPARLEVGDYRQGFGFLSKEGDFNGSTFSNARFELRSGAQTAWSITVADQEALLRSTQIASDGGVWIKLAGQFQRLNLQGISTWAIPAENYQNVGFLDQDRVLLANVSATQVRVVNADGSIFWSAQRPQFSDFAYPPVWQIGNPTTRILGYLSAERTSVIYNLESASGLVLTSIVAAHPPTRAIFAFGALASSGAISVNSSAAPNLNLRPSGAFCQGPGFCPESARAGIPSMRRFNSNSQLVSDVPASALTHALPTRPLERVSAVQLISSGIAAGSIMQLGYSHDGYRQLLLAQRLSTTGQLLWQRTLSTARYDAEKASFKSQGDSVFISASESLPGAPAGKLWELRLSDGVTIAEHSTPALQELNLISSASGPQTCSLTNETLAQIVCIAPGLPPTTSAITGAPVLAGLIAQGSSSNGLKGRVIDGIQSQFRFATIDAAGVYTAGPTLAFQTVPGGFPIRTDRIEMLANGEILASARVTDSSNNNQTFASAIALFAADGTRIWQTQVTEAQRIYQPSSPSSLNTALTRARNGDFYVGLQGLGSNTSQAPVRICRLSNSGAILGCSTAPRAGRVVALMPDPDSDGVLLWLRGHAGNTTASALSTQIYSFGAGGFSALQFELPQSVTLGADSFTADGDSVYAVLGTLNNFGVLIDRPDGQLSVVKIALSTDAIFRNGFEQ